MYSIESKYPHHNKRLSILSPSEKQSIYQRPVFTKEERAIYFAMNSAEENIIKTELRGISSKVIFILQLGYFRSLFKFFKFDVGDVEKDIIFILQEYFPEQSLDDINLCNKKARIHHCTLIKALYDYNDVDTPLLQKLLKKAESLLLQDANPKYVFKELHVYLNKNKYILPGYSTLQDLISRAIQNNERRIEAIIKKHRSDAFIDKIESLLKKESEHRYYLTLIKAPPNSFTLIQATKEREKRDFLKNIYESAKLILQQIGVSHQSTKYYARLVDQFTIDRLLQLDKSKQYFYILCFVYHRYLAINDALTKTLLYQVNKFDNSVIKSVKENVAFLNIENIRNLKKGSEVLNLLTSGKFSDDDKVGELRKEIYQLLPLSKLNRLASFLKKANIDIQELRWEELDRQSHKIKSNVRHIFKSTFFEVSSDVKSVPLYSAITFLQEFLSHPKRKMDNPPLAHVPKATLKFLYKTTPNGKNIDPQRYELFVYRLLKKKINSSDIFISDSIEYRSMEDDLIDKEFYLQNRNSLFIEHDTDFLKTPLQETVEAKLDELDQLIQETNRRIKSGENTQFKQADTLNGKWHVEYKGTEQKDINNPIFQKIKKINLPELLWLVNKETHFLNSFSHILYKDAKATPEVTQLIGTIIGYGTNMGISKMASCSNISKNQMAFTRDTFFREDTLRLANDMIVNATAKLSIQEIYKIGGTIHAAIDGKKHDALGNIFNARHSPKYFNLGKGLSIITLMINFMPAAIKLISPNEYEGHHGLEVLLMNESDLQPIITSTDMHGISDLNFALYDACGYDFQPRYTNLFEASKSIISSDNYIISEKDLIKPLSTINKQLIIDEEDNIKRIISSMLSKTSSVSTIVKKLSASPKSHKTRKAVAQYNSILRSIHVLKSINDNKYRQCIQKALNRTESYHFLTDEVGYANRGKIIAKTELDQIIYKECTRLVCNAILHYNSVILSRIYVDSLQQGQKKQINLLKHISPASWVNINLYGIYELYNIHNISFPSLKNNLQQI